MSGDDHRHDERTETTRTTLADEDPLGDGGDVEEWAVEALLTDYRAASADARYRDRLISFSYYLALVLGGLLLNGIVNVLEGSSLDDPNTYVVLAGIGAVSAANFELLLALTDSVRASRNSAWARRDEIEQYLRTTRRGLLETNESVEKQLGFDYEFSSDDMPRVENVSVGTTMRRVFVALVVFSLFGTLISIGSFVVAGI